MGILQQITAVIACRRSFDRRRTHPPPRARKAVPRQQWRQLTPAQVAPSLSLPAPASGRAGAVQRKALVIHNPPNAGSCPPGRLGRSGHRTGPERPAPSARER